jgi:hypothetical protein
MMEDKWKTNLLIISGAKVIKDFLVRFCAFLL